jgi:membrane-bound lytic murein transglycosylase D
VVKSGDSLWIIAKRYGTTTQEIQKINRLSTTRLRINQVLKVPSQTSAAKTSTKGSATYYVRNGDSPYLIARKNNMSLNHFLKINNLTPVAPSIRDSRSKSNKPDQPTCPRSSGDRASDS